MSIPISTQLLLAMVALGLLALAVADQKARASNDQTADEAAIRETVRQLEAGWNRKKAALFASAFAEDADYVVINGMFFKGRTAIETSHKQIFDTVFRNTTIQLAVKQIRFLRADVALVHVNGHRDAPESEKELVSDAFMTMVMTRGAHGWEIAAFQNTKIENSTK